MSLRVKARLRGIWEILRSSLWFIPALTVVAAVLLAVGLIEMGTLDRGNMAERWPRLFGASAEGSRGLLAAIASSMITVVGVTFSITVVALALASSQYTSRILRNFMRDRANQSVLGVFVGVFAYCIVVLRTIRGPDAGNYVPALAVLVAMLLAFVAIGFLIFFIHHIASSIQATSIIRAAMLETNGAIDRLFPQEVGTAAVKSEREEMPSVGTWATIAARRTGYLQGIDGDDLFRVACDRGVVVRMERSIGEFVIEGSPLAAVAGRDADEGLVLEINAAYTVGTDRTVHQDSGYGIRQIVDIALKALSPGINDTTTAVNAIDALAAILARLAGREIESPYRSDKGAVRLITRGPTFVGLLAEALDQIRQNADRNVAILVRLVEVIEILSHRTDDPRRLQALRRQRELILATAERSVPAAHDRARIELAASTAPIDWAAVVPTLMPQDPR